MTSHPVIKIETASNGQRIAYQWMPHNAWFAVHLNTALGMIANGTATLYTGLEVVK